MSDGCTTDCLTFFLFPTFSNIAAIVDNRSIFSTSNHFNSIIVNTSIGSNVVKRLVFVSNWIICYLQPDQEIIHWIVQIMTKASNWYQNVIQVASVTQTIKIIVLRWCGITLKRHGFRHVLTVFWTIDNDS